MLNFNKTAPNHKNALKAILLTSLMLLNCACTNAAEEIDFSDEETSLKFSQKHLELFHALDYAETDDEKITQMTFEELKAADFTDCSIDVLDLDGQRIYERLSEEKTKEFVEMLTQADISIEEGNVEYPMRNGDDCDKEFQITLSSGDLLFIGTNYLESDEGDLTYYFIINGEHSYRCDKETANKMYEYEHEVFKRFEDSVKASFAEG